MSRHYCPGIGLCTSHPRWIIVRWRDKDHRRPWHAFGPCSPVEHPSEKFSTHAEAIQFATSRARAEALAAVQSAEGVTAR